MITTRCRAAPGPPPAAAEVGLVGQRLLVNTGSLGSYPAFVDIRQSWERRVDNRVAAAIALLTAVRHQTPLRCDIWF
ncbi:MAG: hypothetical protein JOZ09_04115 [Pseudonocardiales bacterium]|nr:hypothetical protein [Pseudonocardiales bacterium]